ncbi:MAG: enoyl-CoA hydratase/isomerase family protein [Pseudomonadota bacterium]
MAEVEFERRGRLGLITLNRPEALNALTHGMVHAMTERLGAWAEDPGVALVAIQGTGDRAFCAGGDIRALYEAGRPGGASGAANWQFYADEYHLNALIKRFPKPYIAIMDGIVMGGGVGVAIHGSLRIATERTLFAMPETGIGLFPDVGGTWFLPRLPGKLGLWLGLTGARVRGMDCVRAGICDVFLDSESVEDALEWLAEGPWDAADEGSLDPLTVLRAPEAELITISADRPHPSLDLVDGPFGAESVEALLAALDAAGDWGQDQRRVIETKSPTCTRIAFRQIRAGATLDFSACMALEYRLARFCMTHGDFYEGVRATIIEKDGAARWTPSRLTDADNAYVETAFATLGPDELRV